MFEGVLAQLSCVVYQGDLPLEIEWLKDGLSINKEMNIITRSLDEYSSILTISQVHKSHGGNYTCLAKNRAATTKHTASLIVNGNFQFRLFLCSSSKNCSIYVPRGGSRRKFG